MIGGFIILFSVLNKILSLVGIVALLAALLSFILAFFHLPTELNAALISGLFEMTLGAQMASETNKVGLLEQVIVASFILAFSGFSIQGQVASLLAETDIRFKPFFIARIIHGFFAATLVVLLWEPVYMNQQSTSNEWGAIPVFVRETSQTWFTSIWDIVILYGPLFTLLMLSLFIAITARKKLLQLK